MLSFATNPTIIRRLPLGSGPTAAELSAGPALLAGIEQTKAPALRWYHIAPPALLLGSAQRLHEVDVAASAAQGIPTHRRRSGGGAVLSDAALLLLDLALPREHPLYTDDVTESYRWIGEVWAAALRDLGLDARPISVAAARADTAALDPLVRRVCFGGRSPYETLVDHRKVVGLAQIRRRAGALYQAGVYLRWSPERSAQLLAATAPERIDLAQQLAARVAGLNELLPQPPDAAMVIGAFEAALTRQTGLTPADDAWSDAERAAQAAELPRYAAIVATDDRR
jgi:lipoate-protein ligase A